MTPFTEKQNRCIYITALMISFLLIIGSIVLHLRQKTHLGRMSFNLDRDRIKPTSGVETSTWLDFEPVVIYSTDKRFNDKHDGNDDEENDTHEASSPEADDVGTLHTYQKQLEADDFTNHDNDKNNIEKHNDDDKMDQIISEMNEDIGDNSEYKIRSLQQDSNACLRCLCMTVNQCRPTFCGSGNPCGLYRISKMYWIDGGKPTITGGSTENDDQDYLTCVNEDTCSSTTIRNYYDRYKRDCNKDGVFDCRDQIALHLLGPSGCLTQNLSQSHANRMKNCLIESNLSYLSYSSEEDYEQYVK